MQNYSQNSNNYFENMLGETANIRCNNIPYFQIFIIPDILPYYDKTGNIKKWEYFNFNNVKKYINLSKDNINYYYHTPNKTLLFIIHLPDIVPDNNHIFTHKDYINYYLKLNNINIKLSQALDIYSNTFGSSVIYNDYSNFIEKVIHYIKYIT